MGCEVQLRAVGRLCGVDVQSAGFILKDYIWNYAGALYVGRSAAAALHLY